MRGTPLASRATNYLARTKSTLKQQTELNQGTSIYVKKEALCFRATYTECCCLAIQILRHLDANVVAAT